MTSFYGDEPQFCDDLFCARAYSYERHIPECTGHFRYPCASTHEAVLPAKCEENNEAVSSIREEVRRRRNSHAHFTYDYILYICAQIISDKIWFISLAVASAVKFTNSS